MGALRDAIELYGSDFSRVHGLYLEHGFCYSEPKMLALARPCNSEDYQKWIPLHEADAWWVELVIGPNAMGTLYSKLPFELKSIGWAREFNGKPEPRFYNFDRLKSILIR
jgi:hypothetical protein